MKVKCNYCDQLIEDNLNYCPYCGGSMPTANRTASDQPKTIEELTNGDNYFNFTRNGDEFVFKCSLHDKVKDIIYTIVKTYTMVDDENIFRVELVSKTLDLNAGQLIDRIGVMLGLGFPCGRELEKLAVESTAQIRARATLKDTDCCLSGIENICRNAYDKGMSKEDISLMCLKYVEAAVSGMCERVMEKYGEMPVVFAGGVMSDKIIKDSLSEKFTAYFAEPEFSADNAGGTAFLTYLKHRL